MSAVLVEIRRGGVVEGIHRGHAVVIDAGGRVVRAWGDPDAAILPRSANKPGQASAMLRAGVPLDGELLALSAASHSGEEFHVDGVRRILALADLDESALLTPPELPIDDAVRTQALRAGAEPSRIAMNCSGKHAAMLLACRVNDWPLDSYVDPEHPLQRAVRDEITDLAGEEPWATAVDGCGAPVFGLTLVGLARLGSACVQAGRDTAPHQVAEAMWAHPEWVAGTHRDATALSRSLPGALVKEGAEAVEVVSMSDGRTLVFKISDGSWRAFGAIMHAALLEWGITTTEEAFNVYGGANIVGGMRAVL